MNTQIDTLIELGRINATRNDAVARSWLSTNLIHISEFNTQTATNTEFAMTAIFGLVTELTLSQSAVVRLINAHIPTLEEEFGNEAIQADATTVVNHLKDLGILNKKRVMLELDDGTEYWTNKVSFMMVQSLEAFEIDLGAKSTMVCRALTTAPTPWHFVGNKVVGTGNLKFCKGASVPSLSVLSAVNRVQAVAYRCNEDMMELVDDMLTNPDYYGIEGDIESQRVLEAIDALEEHEEFFFPVTIDFRGRMYYRGGLITPQGEKVVKALLEFANGKALGEFGMKWLSIHLANVMGADKLSITKRLAYVATNHDAIMDINEYEDVAPAFPEADKFTSFVAIKEYQRAYNAPVTQEYVSHLIVHIDGTNNGLQHASVITKDRSTAEAVNITASNVNDIVRDLYNDIAVWALQGDMTDEARTILTAKMRDLGKPVVMLAGYGAGLKTITEGVAKKLVGTSTAIITEIAKVLHEALTANAGAVSKLVKALKRMAKKAKMNNIQFKTMDGLVVVQEYFDFDALNRNVGNLNVRVQGTPEEALVKAQTALAPNFVHALDATHLRLLAMDTDAPLALVHDSVGARAGDMEVVAESVRATFVMLHTCHNQLDTLSAFTSQKAPSFRGDYAVQEATSSAYIFS